MKFRNLKTVIMEYLRDLEDCVCPIYSTGLQTLDNCLGGGVQPGEMCVIAARPSHGKTLLGLQMLQAMSEQKLSGLMMSEEMSIQALIERKLRAVSADAAKHKLPSAWIPIRDQLMRDTDAAFRECAPILIAERSGSAEKACDAIRQAVDSHGTKVVVLDYIQHMAKGTGGNDKFAAVSEASQMLKQVTLDKNIALIALAQMGRSIDDRKKWIPTMSDIQHSSQIEQDADTLIFLEWPWQCDKSNHPALYRMWILKNRNRGIHGNSCLEFEFNASRQTIADKPVASMSNYTPAFEAYNRQEDF